MIFNTKITPLNVCISIILFVLLCILIKNIFSVREGVTSSVDDSSSIPTFEVTTDMSATGSYASSGWGGVYTEREGKERHGRPSWSNGTAVIWYETIANGDWGAKNLIRGDGWIMYPIVAQHHRLGIADTRPDSIMPPLNQEWISRGGSVVNQGTTFKVTQINQPTSDMKDEADSGEADSEEADSSGGGDKIETCNILSEGTSNILMRGADWETAYQSECNNAITGGQCPSGCSAKLDGKQICCSTGCCSKDNNNNDDESNNDNNNNDDENNKDDDNNSDKNNKDDSGSSGSNNTIMSKKLDMLRVGIQNVINNQKNILNKQDMLKEQKQYYQEIDSFQKSKMVNLLANGLNTVRSHFSSDGKEVNQTSGNYSSQDNNSNVNNSLSQSSYKTANFYSGNNQSSYWPNPSNTDEYKNYEKIN